MVACVLLAACGLESLLQRQVTATVDNSSEIGGSNCPLLVTTAEGEHFEVTLPDGYQLHTSHGDWGGPGVYGPAELVAGTGDLIRVTLTGRHPALSDCKWGTPVEASSITLP
jgi:hypothetical protein